MPGSSPDHMFPTLTAAQQLRLAEQGKLRSVQSGATLVEANALVNNFFIVTRGHLNILKTSEGPGEVVGSFHQVRLRAN